MKKREKRKEKEIAVGCLLFFMTAVSRPGSQTNGQAGGQRKETTTAGFSLLMSLSADGGHSN